MTDRPFAEAKEVLEWASRSRFRKLAPSAEPAAASAGFASAAPAGEAV